jgi:hypothetical protein
MKKEPINIFDAFEAMKEGKIVKDSFGIWFKKEDGKLVDSIDDGKSWYETDEFKYGYINSEWYIVY